MWVLYSEIVCENERIGSHRGACAGKFYLYIHQWFKLENILRQAVKKWSSAFYFQLFKTTNDRLWVGEVHEFM